MAYLFCLGNVNCIGMAGIINIYDYFDLCTCEYLVNMPIVRPMVTF